MPGVFARLHRARPRRSRRAGARAVADAGLPRDGALSVGARQGPLCRRAGRRGLGRQPISRRRCARADRDRLRAAGRRDRSRDGRRARARRCCTRRRGRTSWPGASLPAATSAAAMAAAAMRVGGRFRFHRKTPVAHREPGLSRGIRSRPSCADPDPVDANSRHRPRPSRRSARYAGTSASASLPPMSAAASAARHRFIRRRSSWRSSPGVSAGRCAGRAERREDLMSTTHGFDEIVDAELGARPGRPHRRRSRPRSSATSGPIRSIRGPPPWSRSRSPASCRARTGFRPIAGGYARSRPARRRPGLIAASGVRSRPLSWNG